MGPLGVDLDGLWQDHPNPLVAYGFTALSPPDWEKVMALQLSDIKWITL